MEETGIDGEVLREICDLAEKYHIQKVILFGSRARGDFKRTSDRRWRSGKFCELKREVETRWL